MYAEFDLTMPGSLDELAQLLTQPKAAGRMMLAGGTVALVDLRARKAEPELVVSLHRIDALRGIAADSAGIALGARCTVSDILASPLLAERAPSLVEASRNFAGQMVRNAATIGGNIACGSPAADLVPPLLALDAELELLGPGGARRVPLADYYTGYKKDVRRPDEIIARVLLPAPAAPRRDLFYKLARRQGDAITVVGVAVSVAMSGGNCAGVRIALASVAPVPMRARKAEARLEGRPPSAALIAEAADAAMAECAPIDDIRASAGYRRTMVGVLTRRLLAEALAPHTQERSN